MLYWNFNILTYCTLSIGMFSLQWWRSRGRPSQVRCLHGHSATEPLSSARGPAPPLQTSVLLPGVELNAVIKCRRCVWFASTRCVCGVCPCCVWGQLIPFALMHNVPFRTVCFTVCVSILLLRKDCIHLSFIITLFIVESNSETALLLYLWDKCRFLSY